jgi:hypothetical protein
VAACPEKSRILQLGYCALIWIAKSTPEIPGIATSDMTRSGDSERAAASAANGQVKNLAEKPLICNMAARLDAMTGSSSTTKMHERGDTWSQFLYFSGALGCRGVIYNQYVPRADPHSDHYCSHPGYPEWTGKRPSGELLRTDSAQDRGQNGRMRKKKRRLKATARTTIADIKREMQQPRLAGSVRDDPKYQAALTASFGVKEV